MAEVETTTHPQDAARRVLVEHRSRQLLDAAARLMAKAGSETVSMQAVAQEAGVSVGLIYRYFGGKDELLLAIILDVLETASTEVPTAIEGAGEDPVDQLVAGFAAYCKVIDTHRHAAVLTYRESNALSEDGRQQIKAREVESSLPLRACVADGVAAKTLRAVDVDLVAYNFITAAHMWALKHWYFEGTLTFDDYVCEQTALIINGILEPKVRRRYARHLGVQADQT